MCDKQEYKLHLSGAIFRDIQFFYSFWLCKAIPCAVKSQFATSRIQQKTKFFGKALNFYCDISSAFFFGRLCFLWQDLLFADKFVDEIFVRKHVWNRRDHRQQKNTTRNPGRIQEIPHLRIRHRQKKKSPPVELVFFSVFYIEKDQKRPIKSHIS